MSAPPRHVEPSQSSDTSQKPDYSTWLTKQQAADAIGVSTKTVEQLAADRQIQQASWRADGRGPRRAVYHPDDVARIAKARRTDGAPFVLPAVPAPNGNGHSAIVRATPVQPAEEGRPIIPDWLEKVGALVWRVASEKAAASESSQKLFLTIDEAAAVSGLTPRDLRRAVRNGELAARHKEQRDWRTWRIRRKDLEAL